MVRLKVLGFLSVYIFLVLESSGCSAIGYAIGRGLDPKDTTRSIRHDEFKEYFGEKVIIVTEAEQRYTGELLGISPEMRTGDSVTLQNIYLFKNFNYSKGFREESDISFTEDKLRDILVTEKRGSKRFIFGGIGLAIDVAAVIATIEFTNVFNRR